MRINWPRIWRGIHRLRAGRFVEMTACASRTWTLCEAETARVPKALYPTGAIEKITALSPWRTWDVEKMLIDGEVIHHAASTAHLIDDARLVGAFVYARAGCLQPGYGSNSMLLPGHEPTLRLTEANMVSSNSGSHFFGNHLLDDMPLALVTNGSAHDIRVPTKPYSHGDGYRELLGLARPPIVHRAHIRKLTLFTDFAQNSYKAARYRELRSRLRNSLAPVAGQTAPAGVYIRRGAEGERRALANEPDLERMLAQAGFDIIDPSALSAEQIAARTLDARVVVSVEGSQLSHAIYSVAADAAFLVLQPADRFSMAYKEFTDRLDMRFGFVVGAGTTDSFAVDLGEVQQMLVRLD